MLGSLGVAHVVVAIALLPTVMFSLSYGFFLILVILPGLTWLGILGWRLLYQNEPLRTELRITHLVLAPLAALLISRGFLFLNSAEHSAQVGGSYTAIFGVISLVMGLLAGGLSVVSLCISFSSILKETSATGKPAQAYGGCNDTALPELSGSGLREREVGSLMRWTIRCLALVHFGWGTVLLMLGAWWIFSSLRVLPHMSQGTIWTNLPMALFLAAVHGGPLVGLGVWAMILGLRTLRGHQGVRRALMLTHGVLLLPGILTSVVGFYALRAAEQSAARGGGLLGPIGIFPLAIGLGVVMLAAGTIVLTLIAMPKPKKTPGEANTARHRSSA
jgi:hypothetical protein